VKTITDDYSRFTHVSLTSVLYGVLQFLTIDLRTITTLHDSMRFKATQVHEVNCLKSMTF